MSIRIAVDAMGGDHAPDVVIEGAVEAARQQPDLLQILLVGPESLLQDKLAEKSAGNLPIQVLDAPQVIAMAESPGTAVKTKTRSSIHVGLGANRQGMADAFLSAGNTGAVMAASVFLLGRLPNVTRPSIMGFFPTTRSDSVVLDIGANVDCKPEHLLQFARMGSTYARRVMKRENPVVGLLNVGEEPSKGNEATKSAYALLERDPAIHFKGNVEGRELMHHAADVVVCDGFVGNILLKFGESLATAFVQMLSEEMRRQGMPEADQQAVAKSVGRLRRKFDYEEYGGTPLVGVRGNVIIGHGSSSARAIERMILTAAEFVKQDLVGALTTAFDE